MRQRSTSFFPIQAIGLFLFWFVFLTSVLALPLTGSAQVRYVKTSGSNSNPASATSWASATANLQGAINSLTATGGAVWVAQGTYKPTITTGPGSRTISFSLRNQVAIYGGFVGNETSPSQRPPINPTSPSSTTLSGDIGTPGTTSDNSYHIFYHPLGLNLNSTAVLDGFVVTGGNANGTGAAQYGGGMYNMDSSPSLTNCSFQANSASLNGGGIYNSGGSPILTACSFLTNSADSGGGVSNTDGNNTTLTACIFQTNSAANAGGGMSNSISSPTLTNCSFLTNSAKTGGGMSNSQSIATLTNCSFLANSATNNGGGMFNSSNSNLILTGCSFLTNSAFNGGGMYNSGNSNPSLTSCSLQTNSASDFGAGLYNLSSKPTLVNCSFLANSAGSGGGGLFNSSNSSPMLANCSFQANSAADGGGIYNTINSDPSLTNCVLYNNGGINTFVNTGNLGSNSSVILRYSLFDVPNLGYNYFDSGGNQRVSQSPFVSANSTQLNSCSLAINAGLNSATALSGITLDLAGNPRFYNGGTVDMGAYEYQGSPSSLTVTVPSIGTATVGLPFSQNFSASGGIGPYHFSVASGQGVTGLSLASTGVLSGTPTQAGNFTLTAQVQDAGGCSVTSSPYNLTVKSSNFDLTLLLYALPSALYGTTPVSVVVDVYELNGTATSGSVRVYITKDPQVVLTFDQASVFVGNKVVTNDAWTFDGTSNANFYILTTKQPMAASSKQSFGLTGVSTPGNSKGNLTISATLVSLNESHLDNNSDAEKIDYFKK